MKVKENVLTIGFTAGTLFDMKEAEDIFEKAPDNEKQKRYRDFFQKMNEKGETFSVGPALGLYIALQELKGKVPEDVMQIRFGLSSKFDSAHPGAVTLFNSIEKYMMSDGKHHAPDYHALTGGFEQASKHKIQDADLVFTSSKNSANLYYNNGMASVFIPNRSAKLNNLSYKNRNNNINIYCDYDGVIGDVDSETVYQVAKQMKDVNPVNTFRDHEVLNSKNLMELGPLGDVLKKFGKIVSYYQDKLLTTNLKEEDIPFKTVLLTARGGGAAIRAFNTLNSKGISLSQCLFMDGVNKNEALSQAHKSEITLFLDDGEAHFDRAVLLDNIIPGYVPNELTVGNINLEERYQKLSEQIRITSELQKNAGLALVESGSKSPRKIDVKPTR